MEQSFNIEPCCGSSINQFTAVKAFPADSLDKWKLHKQYVICMKKKREEEEKKLQEICEETQAIPEDKPSEPEPPSSFSLSSPAVLSSLSTEEEESSVDETDDVITSKDETDDVITSKDETDDVITSKSEEEQSTPTSLMSPTVCLQREAENMAQMLTSTAQGFDSVPLEKSFSNMVTREVTSNVIVVVEDKPFRCHRLILSKQSGYFNDYISGHAHHELLLIPVSDVSVDTFEIIYEWLYTARLKLKLNTIADIYEASKYLRMTELKEQCCLYLERILHFSHIMETYEECLRQDLSCLGHLIYKHLVVNFNSIVTCPYFIKYSADQVCLLLCLDEMNIKSEVEIFEAAILWCTKGESNRKRTEIENVMGCVRFALMTDEELVDCMFHKSNAKPILDMMECKEMVLQACLFTVAKDVSLLGICTVKPPVPRVYTSDALVDTYEFGWNQDKDKKDNSELRTEKCIDDGVDFNQSPAQSELSSNESFLLEESQSILIIGGINPKTDWSDQGKSVWQYNPKENQWMKKDPMPFSIIFSAVAIFKDCLYVSGGCDPTQCDQGKSYNPTRNFWRYKWSSKKWTKLTSMMEARMQHALMVLRGQLYAVGGLGSNQRVLCSVECYKPTSKIWKSVCEMNTCRMAMAAVVHRDNIWVCGGMQATVEAPLLDTVECYYPDCNRWLFLSNLGFGRCLSSLVVLDGILHLVGGMIYNSNIESLSAIDYYNKKEKLWLPKAEMDTARHSAVVAAIDHHLYVIGGINPAAKVPVLCGMECYDNLCNLFMPSETADFPVSLLGITGTVLPAQS